MNIALAISRLGPGGAERVASTLANAWARAGDRVDILTLEQAGIEPFFELDPLVRLHALGLAGRSAGLLSAAANNLRRVFALRRALMEIGPDVVVGFVDATNVLVLLACLGLGLPVVACERTDPAVHDPGRVWSLLRRTLYPRAAAVVVQTAAAARGLPSGLRARLEIMPNPVLVPSRVPGPCPHFPRPLVMGLGRLTREKGFDLLLRAFALVAAERPDWSLALVGDGPDREGLEALRDELGLGGRVLFSGWLADVGGCLAQADVFALPSRYEGFPNALCEAMALGLAVVAADCPSGPAEIVVDGRNGLLVPAGDPEALAEALARLMDDEALRRALAAAAPEILERFGLERTLSRWNSLLGRVARG
ncbi:MAG: glycosyltransferase family 4 protein [Desulfovibrionaceae bacterium]|nr:glycosyltransferase family 4 protein [Desulfovibrionaceae bacterium]